jgi:hypothetical protein
MTRVVLNPYELRSVAGLLRDRAADAELTAGTLRAEPMPELPAGMAGVAGDVQAVAAGFRRQAVQLGAEADDLLRRATRIEADQARAFALSRLLDPTLCNPRPVVAKESYWDGVRHRAGVLYDFFIGDDLHTAGDSNAPWWARGVAVAGMLPVAKPFKVGKAVIRGEKAGEHASDAARAARRFTHAEWQTAAGSRSHASRELNKTMRDAGLVKPDHYEAHHIVAPFDPEAVPAQRILARFGIGPNEADNGVFLPGPRLNDADPLPVAAPHRPIHTDAYYAAVARELRAATSREDAIAILADIRRRLEANTFPR